MARQPRPPKPRKRRQDSFFGLHFDLHPQRGDTELGARVTAAMVRRIIRAARPDYLQYDCKGHAGYLGYRDSRVGPVAGHVKRGGEGVENAPEMPGAGIVNDSLAIYREVTAAEGVALFVHFSGVWDNAALEAHPEWAAVKPEGTRYDKEGRTSTFGPYVTELMIPEMKEVVDRYRVDGFWVDGDAWAAEVDYGEPARARFRELTGQADPPTKPGEPYWLEWITLQRDQFFRYVKAYMDALHAYTAGGPAVLPDRGALGAEVQIASNWLYSPMAPEPVKLPVDFISGDYSPNDSVNSARFNGRQMAGVGLPWDLMAWAFALVGGYGPGNSHLYKPAEQLMQEAAAVISLGGGFQMYFHPDRHGGFPDWQIETMRRVADFCHARREVCFGSQSVPQVALLLDTASVFRVSPRVYSAGSAGEYTPLQGMLHAMLEAGHGVDVVTDHGLAGQLDRWPVIVVPEWEHLPPGLVTELADYARRGGSLLIVGAAAAGLFRDHLGATLEGEPTTQEAHLQVKAARGKSEAWAVPLRGLWQNVRPRTGRGEAARVLAHRTSGRHPEMNPLPAATLAPLGRGKIAAVYGPLASGHAATHGPALRDFVDGVLRRLYRPLVSLDPPQARGEGPAGRHSLDVVLRRKEERLVVHLNNVAGMPTAGERYLLVERIPPTGPVGLRVRLDAKPRRVSLEPEGRRLTSAWRGGELTLRVPDVHIHAAVVIEV